MRHASRPLSTFCRPHLRNPQTSRPAPCGPRPSHSLSADLPLPSENPAAYQWVWPSLPSGRCWWRRCQAERISASGPPQSVSSPPGRGGRSCYSPAGLDGRVWAETEELSSGSKKLFSTSFGDGLWSASLRLRGSHEDQAYRGRGQGDLCRQPGSLATGTHTRGAHDS